MTLEISPSSLNTSPTESTHYPTSPCESTAPAYSELVYAGA